MIACLKGERKKSLKRERNCKGMRIPLLFKELYLQPEKDEPVQIIPGTRTCTCRKRQRSRKRTCSRKRRNSARILPRKACRSQIEARRQALERWRRVLHQGSH